MSPVQLWSPSRERRESSQMFRFMRDASAATGRELADYDGLHRWSVEHYGDFWRFLLNWSGIVYEGDPEPAVVHPSMPGATFFPGVRLNFAENLLRHDGDARGAHCLTQQSHAG